jgi:hypothetical protein
VKFAVEQAMKTQKGAELQLYSFSNLSARWEWVVNVTPRPLYRREKDPVPIEQESVWAPE